MGERIVNEKERSLELMEEEIWLRSRLPKRRIKWFLLFVSLPLKVFESGGRMEGWVWTRTSGTKERTILTWKTQEWTSIWKVHTGPRVEENGRSPYSGITKMGERGLLLKGVFNYQVKFTVCIYDSNFERVLGTWGGRWWWTTEVKYLLEELLQQV